MFLCLWGKISFSQKQFNVLDWKSDVTLNTYLVQKMHDQYDVRRKEFAKAITSKKSAEEYKEDVRRKVIEVFGAFPAKTPLNAKITGTIQRDGYRIEKIIYESFPNHHVTSNLYIPNGKGKFPAALLFCGHEDVSKATESYQKTAILFATHGFVVFVIDPISQSERYQLTDTKGKSLIRGGTTEHTLLNEESNLVGTSTPADELWDNERGLDYLITRPEVDANKIGCLGNSGGGMQTIYFAGYDRRIKVIAPCSYLATRERTLEMTGPADGCAQMPNEGKLQLELDDYLMAAAPSPTLILAGRYDFIDYSGALIAYDELKKFYTALGQSQKVDMFTYDDGHGISKPKREAAVTWFRRWLYNDPTPIKEGDIQTLTDKELFCTSTGQVSTEYPNEVSIPKRNIDLFNSLKPSREKFLNQDRKIIINKIQDLLSINTSEKIEIIKAGSVTKENITYGKFILRKQNEVPLPILVAYPSSSAKKIIVWFSDAGKNKIADSTELINSYLKNDCAIILADLRGLGETEDRIDQNDPKYFNKEYRNAMFALHIGHSLVAQRTNDVVTAMQFIQEDTKLKNLPIEINAPGFAALPALYAALFNTKIDKLNLYNCIKSFKDILEKPTEKNWYSYVIPNVLSYYDIPDLVKLVGEDKIKFYESH